MSLVINRLVPVRRHALAVVFATTFLAATGGGGCVYQYQQEKQKSPFTTLAPRQGMPEFLSGTIYERTHLANNTPYTASSYALVGQLRGTGDSTAPSTVREYMLNEIKRRGFANSQLGFGNVSAGSVLRDKNYAIVVAEAAIPPGARKGDFIDVRVSCLPNNDTTSLAHGMLFETDLKNNGADRNNPGAAIHPFVRAKGPIMVNPAYALDAGPNPVGQARVSLRTGVVMFSGLVMQDRPIFLQMREPSNAMVRQIEARINERFQDATVASAKNEAIVEVMVPRAYRGDWEHFMDVVQHLWLESSPEFNVKRAKMLAAEAVKPGAPLMNISYCWEGIGKEALPFIQPLLTHPQGDVAFAAARAAAFVGDRTGVAEDALVMMARTPLHPFRLSAIQTLGALPKTSALNHKLRPLLDAKEATVRIEAYKVLCRNGDASVITSIVGPSNNPNNEKFLLDVVPTEGPPLIYATRQGPPRIAIIGKWPVELQLPVAFRTLDGRFTITSVADERAVALFYRDASDVASGGAGPDNLPVVRPGRLVGNMEEEDRTPHGLRPPVKVMCLPDLGELVARLGGRGLREETPLDFTYGEVIAIVQKLTDSGLIAANDGRSMWGASFMLQELPSVQNVINAAPVINAGVAPVLPGTPAARPAPVPDLGQPRAAAPVDALGGRDAGETVRGDFRISGALIFTCGRLSGWCPADIADL